MEVQLKDNEGKEDNVAQQIYNRIVQLNRERLELEKEHNFIEAGRLKDHLTALGEEYKNAVLFTIRERQRQEKESLEHQYDEELKELSGNWDKRLEDSEEEIKQVMTSIQEKQNEELQKYEEELKQNMPAVGRMPPDVLNLEFQIEKMVKDQRYTEAAQLQKKLDKQRREAEMKIHQKTEEKIKSLLENLIKKHETELQAVEARLNAERDVLLTSREKEFENIHSKFKVFREKLEKNHTNEFNREEKTLKGFKASSNYLAYDDRE